MYAVTSIEPEIRTRATFRSAELGFFGVVVYTRVQTPRRWGAPFRAGVLVLLSLVSRPLRTNCWIVGTLPLRILALTGWLSGMNLRADLRTGARSVHEPAAHARGLLLKAATRHRSMQGAAPA